MTLVVFIISLLLSLKVEREEAFFLTILRQDLMEVEYLHLSALLNSVGSLLPMIIMLN